VQRQIELIMMFQKKPLCLPLLSLLALLSCSNHIASAHDGSHSRDEAKLGPFEAKQNGGTRGRMKKWRIAGEFTPDEKGCYEGEFTTFNGKRVIGTFKECIKGETKVMKNGTKKFRVKTTFTTKQGDKVETTCRITSRKRDGLGGGYTCKERCKVKDGKGIKFPSDAGGTIIMSGMVDHSDPDKQRFDRLWTLRPKNFLYCAKDTKTCVADPDVPGVVDGAYETDIDLIVRRRRSDKCNFAPCPYGCGYGEDIGFGNRGLCQDD